MNPVKAFLLISGVGGFVSVAFGAFAAHGLKDHLDAYHMGVFRTGVEYQFYHSLAIALVLKSAYTLGVMQKFQKLAGYSDMMSSITPPEKDLPGRFDVQKRQNEAYLTAGPLDTMSLNKSLRSHLNEQLAIATASGHCA